MVNFLIVFHKRLMGCCYRWSPVVSNLLALGVILAGVWGSFDTHPTAALPMASSASCHVSQEPEEGTFPPAKEGSLSPSPDQAGAEPVGYSSPSAALQSEYIALMRDLKLGDLDVADPMLSAVVSRMPEAIGDLAGDERKKAFIGLMLPTVMIALDEVRQERQLLLTIVAELGGDEDVLSFEEDRTDWQTRLGPDKAKYILALTRKYRTTSAKELVNMVNVLPPSLIIAQGAIESAWGASRMALNANNLFGVYASMVSSPAVRGSEQRVVEYDSILDSVRAYILNINRLSAYKELRRIRLQTLDSMRIADGLSKYSERKGYYIADVKHIIEMNRLQDYDLLILAAG